MNNPHVDALNYRFVSEDVNDRFDGAGAMSERLGRFEVELRDGVLSARPDDHFADEQGAQDALEPLLRDWEAVAYVDRRHRIRFDYMNADIRDMNPEPGSATVHAVAIRSSVTMTTDAMIVRNNSAYPQPDQDFRQSAVTDALLQRLRRYRSGGESLTATSYWMLTKIETEFGGPSGDKRKAAARALGVEEKVLDVIGKLSSRADPAIGRKAKGDTTPLSGSELAWLDSAITRLTRRAGEYAASPGSLPIVSMSDLPTL